MFQKRELGREMAFGKIPAYCKYELYMERYRAAAAIASTEFAAHDAVSVLDIGSGRGRLKHFFDSHHRVAWHGVEVIDEMMRTCADIGYQMHRHDIEKARLPFADASFDMVAGLHVLEHLANPHAAVQDMARVLRPGGLLVLGVPTKPPLISELIAGYYHVRQTLRPEAGRTCNAFSALSFARFLRGALGDDFVELDTRGFRLISARRWLPLEDWHWFYKTSTWFGRNVPWLTPEINVVLRKEDLLATAA